MRGASATLATPVDLHLHTRHSDGDEAPADLARRCVDAGLHVAAVTDHNTVAGIAAFEQAVGGRLTVVPACEVTATWRGEEAHCLAYLVDPHDLRFQERIGGVHDAELAWWRAWTDRAQAIGVPLTWDEVARRLGGHRVAYVGDYLALLLEAAQGDPRFAGYPTEDYGRLVADWCRPGRPLHVEHPEKPDVVDVLSWIEEAGGVGVLAHPGQFVTALDGSECVALLEPLREAGLAGLEVWTSWHTPADSDRLAGVCDRLGLVATAGSDYHGVRVKPWAPRPGLLPALPVDPLAVIDALHDRRPVRTSTEAGL
ncbi:putative phosphoesterase [Actinacidiphila reveromycinica]|uniref:Putative phosphoesterase n=1 Tax=Actinacidiphila reveromycinica TaxID=659352 RepID=A0A7U3UUY4_9ACTN|nr:PHP domain-containing protein [Streptomyces sp. SN-593]BBA99205.1 putative phosphoesterase [Streptomyces sp. SN-593]